MIPTSQPTRQEMFSEIISLLNDEGRQYGGLWNCGYELGYCRIFLEGGMWECEWFDEAETFGTLLWI